VQEASLEGRKLSLDLHIELVIDIGLDVSGDVGVCHRHIATIGDKVHSKRLVEILTCENENGR
jgi:hypothetical protein